MPDNKLKLVFMGTAGFAVPSLNKLVSEKYDVELVVTQPDRKKGRGQAVAYSHVKQAALDNGFKVYQPANVNDKDSIDILKDIVPDAIIVIAYGQLLKRELLDIPRYGCINIHASILPDLRGAAPINRAIVHGFRETGVTTMLLDEGMDSGDILLIDRVEIDDTMDAITLTETLSNMGADLLVMTLEGLRANTITPEKQDADSATYAPMMTKADGLISFTGKTGKEIHDMVRGLKPWPGAFTTFNGKSLKLLTSSYDDENSGAAPGMVVRVTKESFYVAAKSGAVEILSVQPQNKRAMAAADFINGYGIKPGMRLGD